ncbi:zinc finger and BTB domain-containing protein 41 [Notolabrus celidotus]|uniref:zinc finger and BTB domain-containing protein 41 n=1 Tax=Notolabrus celidotus TaxID=1203425 RepID=UPI0014900DDF|nr:zinc finger and BTB domain-containing protein 41 [Notolabrus celidotus]XP_034559619.1 zinc finger and BTB domain-containing protein 41 [Notolabrus celidotus]XP_034559620.1 zinc finger and BTB domain-containing protein 41 [Notolabrus celidotus]XP_034559621.1 zinc finger and BTB domain-containing protein 41 [Notolabrus celidotus]
MKKKPCNLLPTKRGRQDIASYECATELGTVLATNTPPTASETQPESTSQIRRLSMQRHSHNLLKFLDEDRSRQRFCDVSVSVGGTLYNAHKVVLAHGSSYFHAELSKNPATAHVTLDHVDDSIFQHLLGLLYTSECVVAERELPALIEAARFLDMMDILKLLCEEGYSNPVQVIQAQDEMRGCTVFEMIPSESPADDTDIQSSPSQHLSTEISLQNNLDESLTNVPQETSSEAEKMAGQTIATTRRSARRRRAPTKYQKDNAKETSENKQSTDSARDQDEERVIEVGKMVVGSQVPKPEMPKPVTGEVVDEGEVEEEGDMGEDMVAHRKVDVVLADKVQGQQGSDVERAENQAVQEVGVRASTAGSSTQGPVYPEGLAPVIIQTSSKKTLKCPKCDKTFDRAGKYESHTRVHTGEKPFQCDICLQRYSTKSNLTVHKKKHTSDAPIQKKEHKCPFCSKLHASKKTLAKHVRRFHPDHIQEFLTKRKRKSEGWKCAICLKTFSRRPHLQEHMILHTQDRPFKCSFCDEFFKSRFARLKHQEKYHLGPFPCEICGRQFNDTGNRKRHIECTHGGKRKWTCFVCGKSVRERTTLREHMRIHSGEKPHLCSICGQSFRHGSSYRLHLRVHHDDKRYECDECGKTFIRHDHLTKHQKIHSGEKAHQCEECGKCFRRHDHLTVHYKSIHLGEKVWQKYKTAVHQCEVCKKEFKGKSSLEMHFRTHSGEKPHRCPECNQTFRIKKTLTKHMVIHSDARPFNCPHCSATFKRKDKLKYHVDHVHSTRFTEQPISTIEEVKIVSVPFEESSKSYSAEPKSALSPPPHANVCVPVTLVPVQMAGGAPGHLNAHRATPLPAQTHSAVSMQAQGQQQNSGYQASSDLAFLEKYTLTPQPANIVHPVRPDQMLDPREQSYLGTLLGLDSASSVQNISNSEHSH